MSNDQWLTTTLSEKSKTAIQYFFLHLCTFTFLNLCQHMFENLWMKTHISQTQSTTIMIKNQSQCPFLKKLNLWPLLCYVFDKCNIALAVLKRPRLAPRGFMKLRVYLWEDDVWYLNRMGDVKDPHKRYFYHFALWIFDET